VTRSWQAAELLWREWDGEAIVYGKSSGSTHLLNPMAAEVLRIIETKAKTPLEISHQLASRANVSVDTEVINKVETLLANLDHLGLIEPVPL
jgi:PqqD family protein of HPr-rel-A system